MLTENGIQIHLPQVFINSLSLSQYPLVLTHLTQVRLTKENQNETENEELLETLHDDVGCGEEKE